MINYAIRLLLSAILLYLGIKISTDPNPIPQKESKDVFLTPLVLKLGTFVFHFFFAAVFIYCIFIDQSQSDSLDLLQLSGFFFGCSFYIFRLWTFRVLGNYFTFMVTIKEDHQLIQSGPYKYLMHPSYTGMVLGHAGSAIFLRFYDCKFWIAFFLWMALLLGVRLRNEESALEAHFGKEFIEYRKKRWRFMPFIY